MRNVSKLIFQSLLPCLFYLAYNAAAKAILGVDLGSLYMKVALVQRNSPLEIVTNLHSKRKTEQLILFDRGTRFYGADASSVMARKPLQAPEAMSIMLGRGDDHPFVQVLAERHYPLMPKYNDTRSGVSLDVDGVDFTPEELVAMVLSHAKDITTAFGAPNVRDCVMTVPSFYTQHERQALLDAAELADLNVLGLIDENAAAALHYGIDRVDEKPVTILFYNMGGSSLEVSVVRYHSYETKDKISRKKKTVGSFEVLGKGWDATLGGKAFDAHLVDFLATEFNKNPVMEGKDIRDVPRAMAKLRIQANKVKHVLSANTDFPVFVDGLYKDTGLSTHISRSTFEQLTHELLERSVKPIGDALEAANLTLSDIDQVELIGGGMRIPKVQEMIKSYLGEDVELGRHINSDEAMALGAAFHGANVSTAFRVRQVGMTDVNPFEIGIELHELDEVESSGGFASYFGFGKKKEEEKENTEEEERWEKSAVMFKSFGKVGVKKTIAFSHDKDVHCSVNYNSEDKNLPANTEESIVRFKVTGVSSFVNDMKGKDLGKPKISLQFELTTSGITNLIKAEAVLEETVVVQEEVEVDEEEEEKEGEGEDTPEEKEETVEEESVASDTEKNETEEPKKEEKKKKKVMVDKEMKKVHRRTLDVETYYTGRIKPYSDDTMVESKAKLGELARRDHERVMLEEAKNKYESGFYMIRNKMSEFEDEISLVSTEEQRTHVLKMAEEAEDWMYYEGGDTADLTTYNEKYEELMAPANKIFLRLDESTARPAAIAALNDKLGQIEELMAKWETSKPQVTEDERGDVLSKVDSIRKWISEQEEAQEKTDPWDEPAFLSADVPKQTKSVESLIGKLSKRPKPKVESKKEEPKNETSKESEEQSSNETETENKEETSTTEEKEEKPKNDEDEL